MTMKVNVKLPTYAKELGKGKFMAAKWACQYCGRTVSGYSSYPPNMRCKMTGGNCVWVCVG